MALNRLGAYSGGYNAYNIPSVKENTHVDPATAAPGAQPQQPDVKQQEQEQPKPGLDLTVEVPSRENASIENIAISFGQYDRLFQECRRTESFMSISTLLAARISQARKTRISLQEQRTA